MAVYFPTTLFEARTMTLPLSRSERLIMEHAIEVAIALLDRADGDCDLEDDELHDDALDSLGEAVDHEEEIPTYGLDQSMPLGFRALSASGSAGARSHGLDA